MDAIQGINLSPYMSSSTSKNLQDNNDIDSARMRLMLDAQRSSGEQLVKMIENLGNNIDTYA